MPAEDRPGPPPRVLHVDTATQWRGGQVQLTLLLRGMAARGWPAWVACPPGSPLWRAVEGVADRLPVPSGRSPRTPLRLARAGADLLAAHTSHAHGLAALTRQMWGTPLVVHRRVDFRPHAGWKYRRPDAYVCVSQAVADIVADVLGDGSGTDSGTDSGTGLHVVHDGVAPLPVAAPAADGPAVLAVGARVPHKGHRVLVDAARLLPGVDIGVAGAGPLTWPGLRWLGARDDVPALLAAASVFVHPSVEEGMGQAVVEAMLAGLPVVVTDAGGLPEVVGDTGIVVPAGDASALAAGIRRALAGDHPDPARARQRALRLFSVDAMVEGTLAAYRAVLDAIARTTPGA